MRPAQGAYNIALGKAKDVPFLTTGIKMSYMWGKIHMCARLRPDFSCIEGLL